MKWGMNLLLLLDKSYMKMDINWTYFSIAVIAGILGGLYIIGKRAQKKGTNVPVDPKIKVSGNDIDDLEQKLRKRNSPKNKVNFEFAHLFSYEQLVEWINNTDLEDLKENGSNYGCLIVRSSGEIDQFNIDMTSLSEEQKSHLFGAMIVNTENNKIISSRWIVCDSLDQDLLDVFGNDNIKVLK